MFVMESVDNILIFYYICIDENLRKNNNFLLNYTDYHD
jgi:hypothetical protein